VFMAGRWVAIGIGSLGVADQAGHRDWNPRVRHVVPDTRIDAATTVRRPAAAGMDNRTTRLKITKDLRITTTGYNASP
jgi:hypothetical protein